MRLIDVDAFAERMLKAWDTADEQKRADIVAILANIVTPILSGTPTVDAVEVVRCKDCRHWHADTAWCYHHSHFIDDEGGACHPWESPNWKMFDENDYCSYGERKVSE